MRQSTNTLDLIAEELVQWLDDMGNQLFNAMAQGGSAPFAAQLTEQQKLDYWTAQMFSPDGSPNLAGRAKAMQTLGPEGFATVYKAVLKAHPDLAVPSPPPGAAIPAVADLTPPSTSGPKLPGLPPTLGIPRQGGMLPQGDAGAPVPMGGPLG